VDRLAGRLAEEGRLRAVAVTGAVAMLLVAGCFFFAAEPGPAGPGAPPEHSGRTDDPAEEA
jgi:hypothetical protein